MPERTEYAHGMPSWVDLATTDVAGAETFYSGMFGWEATQEPADESIYSMQRINGKDVAGIYEQREDQAASGMPPAWTTYITVDDVDARPAKVGSAGGTIIAEPFDVMDAGRMSIVGDPTGGVVAFWRPKQNIGAHLVNEHGLITWSELISSDVAASTKFLEDVLGVTTAPMPNAPGEYTMVMVEGAPVAGLMQRPEKMGEVPSHWMVYFEVRDADLAAAKAAATGGTVVVPPFDPGPGRIVVLQDPQGATFGVIASNPDFSSI